MLQPLDPYLDAHPEIVEDYEENVAEALRNAAQYDDGLYGLLNCYETCVMWLNNGTSFGGSGLRGSRPQLELG